jgi:arylsulfatase A
MKKNVILVLVLNVLVISSCSDRAHVERPNILIFLTDDQGYADVGVYDAEGFVTPHLDRLADQGIRFTNFYVPATVCTPSRAGLLTGQYPKRVGLHEAVIYPFSTHGLELEHITLAEALRDAGYETYHIGKWHLGHEEQYMPNNQGFDYFYGVPYSNDMDSHYYAHNAYQSPPLPLFRNDSVIGSGIDQRFLTLMYTREAVSQIRNRDARRPFFMYMAHSMPHVPLHVSEQFKDSSEAGLYGDVIMELDWSMGEIVKALEQEGERDNTIIIFTSDNGPQLGSAGPLRGKKAETWEGGQRVPGIISWPQYIAGGKVSHQVISTLDLFPTLLKQAGVLERYEKRITLDGRDISAHLKDTEEMLPDHPFYYYNRNGRLEAVRLGKWKLHIAKELGWDKKTNGSFETALYDLSEDPGEQVNRANEHPEVVKMLHDMMLQFDATLDLSLNESP